MVCYWGEVLWFVNQLMDFKGFTLDAFHSETKIPLSGGSGAPSAFTQLRFYQDAQDKKAEPIKNPAFICPE